jgi:hypothetical protein
MATANYLIELASFLRFVRQKARFVEENSQIKALNQPQSDYSVFPPLYLTAFHEKIIHAMFSVS